MSNASEPSPLIDAIHDLSRITLALSGKFATKAEAMRALSELAIPGSRIASLLNVPLTSVTSTLAKARKKKSGKGSTESIAFAAEDVDATA